MEFEAFVRAVEVEDRRQAVGLVVHLIPLVEAAAEPEELFEEDEVEPEVRVVLSSGDLALRIRAAKADRSQSTPVGGASGEEGREGRGFDLRWCRSPMHLMQSLTRETRPAVSSPPFL